MNRRSWIFPGIRDPRWTIIAFLVSYDLYALTLPQFSRYPIQWAAGILACVLTDLAFLFWRRLRLVPVSGFISSLGLLLLLDSPFTWPYALVGVIAIASKHLIRVGGGHIFNPLNFGIVVVLLAFPQFAVSDPSRWGNTSLLLIAIVSLGALAAWRARRLDLALSYTATFMAGAWLRSRIWTVPFSVACTPMTGAAFHLFTFYMITDPMTTPNEKRSKILYGAAIGIADAALRQMEFRYAPLLALFLMSAFLPYLRRAGDEPRGRA